MSTTAHENTSFLIINLTSQFLYKLLDKDPNLAYYLKQWDSFRQLLSATPFSFSSALSYLSNMTIPTLSSAKSSRIGLGYTFETYSLFKDDCFSLPLKSKTTDTSKNPSQFEGKYKKVHSVDYEIHANQLDLQKLTKNYSYNPSGSTQDYQSFSLTDYTYSSPEKHPNNNQSSTEDSFSDTAKDSIEEGTKTGDISNYSPCKDVNYEASKYSMDLLVQKAKSLKEKVRNNTENFMKKKNPVDNFTQIERSPLRNVLVFEKKETDFSNSDKISNQLIDLYINKDLGYNRFMYL